MRRIKVKVCNGPMDLEAFLNNIDYDNVLQILHGTKLAKVGDPPTPCYTVIYQECWR